MARCRTCENPQAAAINTLIAAGTPIRAVARMYGVPRTSLARHASHIRPLERRLGVLPDPPLNLARIDPLEEALELASRAHTERERLKALEQIRAATGLKLRSLRGNPDEEAIELLDRNIFEAEEAYRQGSGGFESTVRALQGLRSAIRQRLDAVKPATIEVPIVVTFAGYNADGTLAEDPPGDDERFPSVGLTLEEYFRGVPARFHHPDRFAVRRRIQLRWAGTKSGPNDVRLSVYETATGALAWASDRGSRRG